MFRTFDLPHTDGEWAPIPADPGGNQEAYGCLLFIPYISDVGVVQEEIEVRVSGSDPIRLGNAGPLGFFTSCPLKRWEYRRVFSGANVSMTLFLQPGFAIGMNSQPIGVI